MVSQLLIQFVKLLKDVQLQLQLLQHLQLQQQLQELQLLRLVQQPQPQELQLLLKVLLQQLLHLLLLQLQQLEHLQQLQLQQLLLQHLDIMLRVVTHRLCTPYKNQMQTLQYLVRYIDLIQLDNLHYLVALFVMNL